MRFLLLIAFITVLPVFLYTQSSTTFLSTFTAERGNTIVPSASGNLWLGGMKDEQILLVKLTPDGKVLERHGIDFTGSGLITDHLTALIEDSDGMLTGCGIFELDNASRGFIFRYNPGLRKMVWSHVVRSNATFLLGVTELGPGGDFVFNGSPHFNGGHAAELIQANRLTGQLVTGKALRYSLGGFEEFIQVIYHEGALYAAGRFTGTDPYPPARMRGVICKIDTATFDLAWTRGGPIPISSSGQFYGRDLIIDDGFIISTASGDHQSPDLNISDIYLKKTDLNGNLVWARQIKLPAFKGEFAEEIINLPDGYMLCGHDILEDTSRLFLLKTDKNGEPVGATIVNFGYNDEFPDVPGRSKMVRLGDALFLTAVNQNNVGQTQGLLLKANLNGFLNEPCDFLQNTSVTFANFPEANQPIIAFSITPSPVTLDPSSVTVSSPELTLGKACGATGTCPDLPDLQMTIDSITCQYGTARLHFSFCNTGGQNYEGTTMFGLYDKNPFTDTAKLVNIIIYPGNSLAPGDCISGFTDSEPWGFIPNRLDTFPKLYAMIGIHPNMPVPVKPDDFPFTPNQPECGYGNNVDSIAVPDALCGDCNNPPTFIKALGSPQQQELAFSMCHSSDGNIYLAGRQGNKPMIAKLTPDGEPIWVRNFQPTISNLSIELAEIIEDSEGKLVLTGTEGASPSIREALIIRYDPDADKVIWAKHVSPNHAEASGILENIPGGYYFLHTNYQQIVNGMLNTRSELWKVNPANGGIFATFSARYLGTPYLRMENMVLDKDRLYVAGSWKGSTQQPTLPMLASLNVADGMPVWAVTADPDSSNGTAKSATYSDLIVDSDFLIAVGNEQVDVQQPDKGVYLNLAKHRKDGALDWMKRYDISMYPEDVLAFPDAYVIFGVTSGNRWAMVKTDKYGNLLLAKTLDITPLPLGSTFYANRQNQLLLSGNHLVMADHTQGNAGNDILFLRTDVNFSLEGNCDFLKDKPTATTHLPASVSAFVLPAEKNANLVTDEAALFSSDSLESRQLCPICLCADKPDITCRVDSTFCSAVNGLSASMRICNEGQAEFPSGFYVNYYDKNPLTDTAKLLFQVFVPDRPAPGDCIDYPLPLDAGLLNYPKIYTLAGVNGNVPTPAMLDSFPYPGGFAECDYANNLDSFDLKIPDALPPALGPDRTVCAGATVVLDAGPGYVSYQWENGPPAQTFTVSASGVYSVAVTDACGRELRDTVEVMVLPPVPPATITIPFYPGDSVTIGGAVYTQPGTVLQTLSTVNGCDSVVTYILVYLPAGLNLQCPASQTVMLPLNQTTMPVSYPLPVAVTDCPDPAIDLNRLQGPPSGGAFQQGVTQVCYEAANQCGIRDTCCFTVTVLPADVQPCDVKTPPGCLRYELLDIRFDAVGNRRYRVRITNACASPLQYAYIQLPKGVTAVSPADLSVYTAPGGNTYTVRNPNASVFYSIRFKALAGALTNGQSEIFEYTLPQQSAPDYIHVAARLADGSGSETHLNTFYCPVLPYSPLPVAAQRAQDEAPASSPSVSVSLRPNPNDGHFSLDLRSWPEEPVYVQVLNAQGQRVLERCCDGAGEWLELKLPGGLANGLYYVSLRGEGGRRAALRFVLER